MFTKREKQILELIAKGFTSNKIANLLCISTDTVKMHRKNMIQKARSEGLDFESLLRLAIDLVKKGK
jgi:DNA-binding CsgD family transcriptional regulator